MKRQRVHKYQVDHARTSGGPKFYTLADALAYIAHCLRNGNDAMSIAKL